MPAVEIDPLHRFKCQFFRSRDISFGQEFPHFRQGCFCIRIDAMPQSAGPDGVFV